MKTRVLLALLLAALWIPGMARADAPPLPAPPALSAYPYPPPDTATPTPTATRPPSPTPTATRDPWQRTYLPLLLKLGAPTHARTATPTATRIPPTSTITPTVTPTEVIRCVRVIDGDTIELNTGQRLRYIGIDAPESSQCYANEATQKNRSLVEGKAIRLEKDISEVDRYGRLLRYVHVAVPGVGEVMVNGVLVHEGFAIAKEYLPDIRHAAWFAVLEAEAITLGRGLWSACVTPTVTATRKPSVAWTPTASRTWTWTPTRTGTTRPTSTLTRTNTVRPTSTKTPTTGGGGTVYITNTGSKYHRDGCRYLSKSKIPKTCSWVTSHGYGPCSVCNPWCP